MKLTLIAAIGKNRELGKNNDMIWHLHLIKWRKANNEEAETSSTLEY